MVNLTVNPRLHGRNSAFKMSLGNGLGPTSVFLTLILSPGPLCEGLYGVVLSCHLWLFCPSNLRYCVYLLSEEFAQTVPLLLRRQIERCSVHVSLSVSIWAENHSYKIVRVWPARYISIAYILCVIYFRDQHLDLVYKHQHNFSNAEINGCMPWCYSK